MRKLKIYIQGRERLEIANKRLREVRAEISKKPVLHPLMPLLKPWWSVLTAEKNTYRIIKTKILRHLFHQQENLTKTGLSMVLFLRSKCKLPFWKWKQKSYKWLSCGSMDKKFTRDVLLKKVALKVSQNPNTCNRVSF